MHMGTYMRHARCVPKAYCSLTITAYLHGSSTRRGLVPKIHTKALSLVTDPADSPDPAGSHTEITVLFFEY